MRGFLKFVLFSLISLTSLNAGYFDNKSIQFFRDAISRSFPPAGSEKKEASFISSQYLRIGNDIYSVTLSDTVAFNTALKSNSGFFFQKQGDTYTSLHHYDSSNESIDLSCQGSTCQENDYYQKYPQAYKKVTFSYYSSYSLSKVATCPSDQNFNSNTRQCQKCNDNESWDADTNTCYRDCAKDGGINKFANTNGGCVDCSKEQTAMSALHCLCMGTGHGSGQEYYQRNTENPALSPYDLKGRCTDGSIVDFTDPAINDKPQKPDDNKTKPDTPKPDNNKTKPDDPKPDDPTTPGSGDKGKDGKKDGKGSKDDAKGDNNTTIINNNNGKNNGNDPKFNAGDFNYDNLKKDEEGLTGKYLGAIGDSLKNFDGFKNGVDQFIDNVKGKGLSDISKQSVPKTCSHKETIDFFGRPITMDFDFCKIIAPASGAFYYLFYVFFFGCFLFLIIKLLIFSF